jgi:hypothetical protein
MKRQTRDRKELSTNYTFDKGIVSKTYKESQSSITRTQITQFKNGQMDTLPERTLMANKYMKKMFNTFSHCISAN